MLRIVKALHNNQIHLTYTRFMKVVKYKLIFFYIKKGIKIRLVGALLIPF